MRGRKSNWWWMGLGVVVIVGLSWWWGSEQRVMLPWRDSGLIVTVWSAERWGQPLPQMTVSGEEQSVTILTTGDLMLGRSVNAGGVRRGDWGWSMREIEPFLAPFEVVIANLETPIIKDCPVTDEGMIFCAAEGAAAAMREAGIEVVTLANNHIRNYGARGETETREILTEAGVARVSEGELLIMPIAGMRVGIIADDDVNQPLDMKQWVTKITAAAAQVDHLLVALHFGAEYRYQPLSRQQELAWLAIDSGARIVVGNHAHWLEPVEFYGEGAIIYAHGNFVFDQMWSEETRQGVVVGWTLARDKLQKVEIYPVYISEYGKVDLVSGTAKGEQILRRMQEISGDGVLEEGKLVMRPEK